MSPFAKLCAGNELLQSSETRLERRSFRSNWFQRRGSVSVFRALMGNEVEGFSRSRIKQTFEGRSVLWAALRFPRLPLWRADPFQNQRTRIPYVDATLESRRVSPDRYLPASVFQTPRNTNLTPANTRIEMIQLGRQGKKKHRRFNSDSE